MFGVKLFQRRDLIEGLGRVLINLGQNQKYETDQELLAKIVWPIAKHDLVRLDVYFKFQIVIKQFLNVVDGTRQLQLYGTLERSVTISLSDAKSQQNFCFCKSRGTLGRP